MNRIDTDTLDTFLFGVRKGLGMVNHKIMMEEGDPKLDKNTLEWIRAVLLDTSESLSMLSFGDIKK